MKSDKLLDRLGDESFWEKIHDPSSASHTLGLIEPDHKHRFSGSGDHADWLEFTPRPETASEDLEILEKYKDVKIIVKLNLKNEYFSEGFEVDNIKIVEKFSMFKGLEICSHFSNLSFIETLSQLEYLKIFGLVGHDLSLNSEINVDLSNLKKLKFLTLPIIRHNKENYDFQDCSSLKHFFWPTHYKANSSFIESIGNLIHLQTLSMHRPKFETLDGIGDLSSLKYLEVDYAKSLTDISELAGCPSLIGLDLQNCPNVTDLSALRDLKELKILHIWNCQSIESLSWLKDSQIEYLNFYSSNILDGDLSFISNMPDLKYLRFQNKRHYNKKMNDFGHTSSVPPSGVQVWDFYRDYYM